MQKKDKRIFIDTNVLIYLYSYDQPEKKRCAEGILLASSCEIFVSTQVLNEFSNVACKKLKASNLEIAAAIKEITSTCNVKIIDLETIYCALKLAEKYKYSYFDSLILSSAIECDCTVLYSEDMQDAQKIEMNLTICNPFK